MRPVIGPAPTRVPGSHPACGVTLVEHRGERARDEYLAAGAVRGELATDDRHAGRRGQHLDAARLHHLGDGAATGHPDVGPGGPVQGDAARPVAPELCDALAEQVVGGGVVGLAGVAEAARDRAEDDGVADRCVPQRPQQVQPAASLDVEDEVELGLRLVGQEVADLDSGAVHQHVDAVDALQRAGDGLGVGQVDLVPVRLPAGLLDRGDRGERGARPLDPREFALDQPRRRALAAVADALGEVALEPVRVGVEAREVGIAGVRLRHEVEQVEGAGGARRQVGRDGRHDAPGRAADDEHGVARERACGVGDGGSLDQSDRPAQIVGVADLDRAGVAQRLLDEDVRGRRRVPAGREVDRLHERVGTLARQRLGEAGDGAAQRGRRAAPSAS